MRANAWHGTHIYKIKTKYTTPWKWEKIACIRSSNVQWNNPNLTFHNFRFFFFFFIFYTHSSVYIFIDVEATWWHSWKKIQHIQHPHTHTHKKQIKIHANSHTLKNTCIYSCLPVSLPVHFSYSFHSFFFFYYYLFLLIRGVVNAMIPDLCIILSLSLCFFRVWYVSLY